MIRPHPNAVAAWATGLGVGLAALALTWSIGRRIGEFIWDRSTGAIAGLGIAIVVGAVATVVVGRHLSRPVIRKE
jgi:hypothetical protein